MDMHDDFDSLLKGAAERYNHTALSEQTVSNIIDERLTESKNRLSASFKKEIVLIVVTLLVMAIILAKTFTNQQVYKPAALIALRIALIGGLLYLSGSIFLFFRLLRIAQLPKDTGVREYIQGVSTKTEKALLIYLWISTIASTVAIGTLIVAYPTFGWYWIGAAGIGLFYLNKWYTNKRFGKQLSEMKQLLEEFK